MDVPTWVWWTTLAVTMSVLIFDVVIIGRRPHEPSMKEVSVALGVYVVLAVAFGAGVWWLAGHDAGVQFFAGWLTEYSLSVDNLFVFIIIMARFGVPREYQQGALMVGIVLALVMRGIFIAVGAAAINQFSWIFYVFGLFLVLTAVKLARGGVTGDDEYQENRLIRWAKQHLPATDEWHGVKVFATEGGSRMITPMFLVVLALGTTDLLFALDSIPAIYGLTEEPYLVLTANIFALMGLRQLYFLIGGLLERLVFLSYGLAVLLGFIGVKLVLHAMHENQLPFVNGGEPVSWAPDISILVSLGVIVVVLAVTTVASLLVSGGSDAETDRFGPMTQGSPHDLGRPSEGDVLDLILDDHRRFEALLRELRDSSSDRDAVRRAFAALHVAHAEAEELEVYPTLRRRDAIDQHKAEHGEEEHAEGHAALLEVLEAEQLEDDEFDDLVEELAGTVNHHLTEEELTILNPAREEVTAEVRQRLGVAFATARNVRLDEDCGRAENVRALVERAKRAGLLSGG